MSVYPPSPPQTPDPKDLQEHHAPELERRLLRRGVKRMNANRWACSRCGRSPLVGERLYAFASDSAEQRICELCLNAAPEGAFGELKQIDRVRAAERPLNVRRAA
jgi:hypothetical protein